MAQSKWKKNEAVGNYILEGDQFYISYNPAPIRLWSCNLPETALVIRRKNEAKKFLILDGDFRKEYEKRINSLEECIKFFKENIKHKSEWSDDI